MSLIFLLTIPHRLSMGFRSGKFAGQSSTVTPWSLNQLLVPLEVWAMCQVLAGKWNQHLHKACQQKEAWCALIFPGRWLCWLWTSENTVGPTPADDMAAQINHWLETSHWTSSNMDSVPLTWLPPDSRTLISKLNAKFIFIWKEDFEPLSNSQLFFSLAQVRCFWRCLYFRIGLVAFSWRCLSVVSLMHWLQLQFTPCEALPSVWIGFAWQYSQASGHPCLLCTVSYPISSFQSTLHLICFIQHSLISHPLSVMTLCDLPSLWRMSMIVFWTIAKSAVFPLLWFQRTRIYTVWMVIYWNSNVNIPIF